MKAFALFLLLASLQCCFGQTGKIVWWGNGGSLVTPQSKQTNGVIERDNEMVGDVIAIAARRGNGVAVRQDGTVFTFGIGWLGVKNVPAGLSNVVSVTVENDNSCWAIRRDGTVAAWGGNLLSTNQVAGLSNIVSVAYAGYDNHLAINNDGTVLGLRFNGSKADIQPVKVAGQSLSNVIAVASMGNNPLVVKKDGSVWSLGNANPFYQYASADPVSVGGVVLSNVAALSTGDGQELALKRDGTVVAWGSNIYGEANVPKGLTDVTAIAADEHLSVALKRDGTVVAWGGNYFGQTSMPAGLSSVMAIASGWQFGLALTTGKIPASVYIQPHGRLEELERKADLVFKGEVVSNTRITNAAFNISQMEVSASKFKVISVLKGEALPEVVVEHYSGWGHGMAWSGPSPPAALTFQVGRSYLVYAARMDKPDSYYSPPEGVRVAPDVFRQIADIPRTGDEGAMKTLDARPLADGLSVKEAHWFELNRLLSDSNPTNVLYAIGKLDQMSLKQGEPFGDWRRSDDFKRNRVLSALLPLIENTNEPVATSAIGCFEMEPTATTVLEPFVGRLIQVANKAPSSTRRLAAIRALSGMDDDAVSNSLAQLLKDDDENIRASAVGLLPRFPAGFAEQALRNGAVDTAPKVRAAVADAIGNGKIVSLLPVLEHLWNDTNIVHTSAGNALLKFGVEQVGSILKTHLNAEDFRERYLCQLARNDAGPWLTNLVDVLKVRRENKWIQAKASGISIKDLTNYFNATMALSGPDFDCWNIIHDYLVKLPDSEFQNGKLDWCLDVLEDAGNTGSQEPVKLYELYKTKGLNQRATKFRQENGKCSGFDVTTYFDNVDKQYPAK
jgi:alpha-tubulin suppressor-like RCC1 family protein/HEAT repeat protein